VFLGRLLKVVAVLTADLFVYLGTLSFFLRFGPSGLGPRIFQLGLALAMPAVLTYRTLWKRPARPALLRPFAGMAAASLLTPSLLEPVPILSLAALAALAAVPYYAPKHLPSMLRRTLRWAGRADEDGEGHTRLNLILLKRHVYYFRWWGYDVSAKAGSKMVRVGGQEYLRVGRMGFSDWACRSRALAEALEVARTSPGVMVPATAEEVRSLERGTAPEEWVVSSAKVEREALVALSIAGKRRLTCALEGSAEARDLAVDVVLRNESGLFSVKVLSGRAITMTPQRLRDLLDLYGMVVAR